MYGTDLESATDAMRRASAALGFKPSNLEHGRDVLWYEVRTHNADPLNYRAGVYPRWRYSDGEAGKPSGGVFGGPFVPLSEVESWNVIEAQRNYLFRADSMLESFIGVALQDLQLSESDEACTDERDARDSGTIYTLDARTFESLRRIVEDFRAANVAHIESAVELEPGEDGLRYRGNRGPMSYESLGSTLWLAITGTGVTFTDDGDAPCLQAMADWSRDNGVEGLYFGDNGGVFLS